MSTYPRFDDDKLNRLIRELEQRDAKVDNKFFEISPVNFVELEEATGTIRINPSMGGTFYLSDMLATTLVFATSGGFQGQKVTLGIDNKTTFDIDLTFGSGFIFTETPTGVASGGVRIIRFSSINESLWA